MKLAGTDLDDHAVLALAQALHQRGFEHTAYGLERAFDAFTAEFPLTIEEREQMLLALDDPSDDLAPFRAVLLQEHVGRVGDGLA